VLQVVDTPGHVDFIAEVERCLHVLDGVIVLVDGVRGVESQTEVVWQQAATRGLPRLCFVNKLDREGADFAAVVRALQQRLDCKPLPIVVPLHDDQRRFAGLGCAVTGNVQWFDGRPDEALQRTLVAELRAMHERIVDTAADFDESILADALAGRAIAPARLRAALRRPFHDGKLVPVLGGAALWNRGVDWLLDAVVDWLPALSELPRQGLWSAPQAGEVGAPFGGLVFKVQHVDAVWNFVRVVRGRLRPGMPVARGHEPGEVRTIGELWHVRADRHTAVDGAGPGEIVVVPGELGVRTGDTLCAPDAPLLLPAPQFPAPVLGVAFEPRQAADGDALLAALHELAVDDPTLRVDREHERIVVHGMGELHLDIVAEVVRSKTGLDFDTSRPAVDRRETVRQRGAGTAEVRAFVGGSEQAARCSVTVEPVGDGQPANLVDAVAAGASAAACEELRQRAVSGSRVGPLVGCDVTLSRLAAEGGAGAVASEALVQQAAAKAFGLALEQAEVVELEPWVKIEITCPTESSAPVVADLGARGVEVLGIAAGALGARFEGRAPLARMLGYVTRLRSMTKGRGQVLLRPEGFAPVP
jgi:elongation factor G